MTITASTKLAQVDRDTVSTWIRPWACDEPALLHDHPRSGRPLHLTREAHTGHRLSQGSIPCAHPGGGAARPAHDQRDGHMHQGWCTPQGNTPPRAPLLERVLLDAEPAPPPRL